MLRNFVQDLGPRRVQFSAIGLTCETFPVTEIRLCRSDEHPIILEIVNAAADAYRSVIPEDCWHEPYMPRDELEVEVAAGVVFWG